MLVPTARADGSHSPPEDLQARLQGAGRANHEAKRSYPSTPARKKHTFVYQDNVCFFQLNPPLAEEIHLRRMKSLRDEIPLRGDEGGGFNLSEAARLRFHLRRNAEDFIQTCLDFIVRSTISLKMQGYALIYLRKCDIMIKRHGY